MRRPVDEERGDRAEQQAGQHRALAELQQPPVDDAGVVQGRVADLGRARPGRSEGIVDEAARPRRGVGHDRQHDRRVVRSRDRAERLRADDEADVEQTGTIAGTGRIESSSGKRPKTQSRKISTPVASE
jgi:hypothetical protein